MIKKKKSYHFSHLLLIFSSSLSYIENSVPCSLIQTLAGFPSGPKSISCSFLSVLLVKPPFHRNCRIHGECVPWLYGPVPNTAHSRAGGSSGPFGLEYFPGLLHAGTKSCGYFSHCQRDASEMTSTQRLGDRVECFSSLQNTPISKTTKLKMGPSIASNYFFSPLASILSFQIRTTWEAFNFLHQNWRWDKI